MQASRQLKQVRPEFNFFSNFFPKSALTVLNLINDHFVGGSSSSSTGRSPASLRSRSFAHCLRALCTLGKGEVVEELVRDTVVGPFLR